MSHESHTDHPPDETHSCRSLSTVQRLEWARSACVKLGMRLTPVREALLGELAASRIPARLNDLLQASSLAGRCDSTTVYRTLMLFQELSVIRQVGLPDRAGYFLLNAPGESCHFLVCRRCGVISELPPSEHCRGLEAGIARHHGYADLEHELRFFGICPTCQAKPRQPPSPKLPISSSNRKPRSS